MDALDSNAWKVLSDLLEMASENFSNHGCNDYELDNTLGLRDVVISMQMAISRMGQST